LPQPRIFSIAALAKLLLSSPPFNLSTVSLQSTLISAFFGCLYYPNTTATTPHKLAPRSTRCVFLGYPSDHKGYRCYNLSSRRVINSRHVVFVKNEFPFVQEQKPGVPPVATHLNVMQDVDVLPLRRAPTTMPGSPATSLASSTNSTESSATTCVESPTSSTNAIYYDSDTCADICHRVNASDGDSFLRWHVLTESTLRQRRHQHQRLPDPLLRAHSPPRSKLEGGHAGEDRRPDGQSHVGARSSTVETTSSPANGCSGTRHTPMARWSSTRQDGWSMASHNDRASTSPRHLARSSKVPCLTRGTIALQLVLRPA
jgi:hypothetical protein